MVMMAVRQEDALWNDGAFPKLIDHRVCWIRGVYDHDAAVILCDGGAITPSTLLLRAAPAPASPEPDFTTLEEMERSMIAQAMSRCNGNMTEVARQLGITRQTLYNKIKRYGL